MSIIRALTECYPLQGYQIYLLSHSVCFICNTVLRTNKLEVRKLDLQINTDSARVHVITGPRVSQPAAALQPGCEEMEKEWGNEEEMEREWGNEEEMEREWGNEEEMEREWGNGERLTLYISSFSLHFLPLSPHFLILSPFPPSLSISYIKICHILSLNVKYGTFVANVTKILTYALWGNNSGSNLLRGSIACCAGLQKDTILFLNFFLSWQYNPYFAIFLLVSIQYSFSLFWQQDAVPSFTKFSSFVEANSSNWLSRGSQSSFSFWVWTKYRDRKENAAKNIYCEWAMLCNLESSQCDCCCTPLLPLLSATILLLFTNNSGAKSLINASDTSRYKNLEILGMH